MSARTSLRINLAGFAHPEHIKAMVIEKIPGFKVAAIAIERRRYGKAINRVMIGFIIISIFRINPDIIPITHPSVIEKKEARKPIPKLYFAPSRILEKISRPSKSVPNKLWEFGEVGFSNNWI